MDNTTDINFEEEVIPSNRRAIQLPLSKLIPLVTFGLSLIISITISYTFYTQNKKLISVYQLENLEHKARDLDLFYQSYFDKLSEDLSFLSRTPPIQSILRAQVNTDGESIKVWENRLSTIFGAFLTDKHQIMSLSYVVISNGKASALATRTFTQHDMLSDLDYMQTFEALKSSRDMSYFFKQESVHTLDQFTHWLAKPIINQENNSLAGYIIAEISLQELYSSALTAHGTIKIANEYGRYSIQGQHRSENLFKDFPELKQFVDQHISEGPIVNLKNGSQLVSAAYYTKLSNVLYPSAPSLNILFMSEEHALQKSLNELRSRAFLLAFLLSLIALALSYLVARRLTKNVEQVVRAIEDYETTNRTEGLPIYAKDEMGVIARSMAHMMETVNKSVKDIEDQKFALDQHSIVGITDPDGTIIYANQKFCDISGFTQSELLGRNHSIVNSGIHTEDFFETMYETISNQNVWQGEICNKTKGGKFYWVDGTIVPITDANGNLKNYIGISTDISSGKQLEAELRLARDQAEAAGEAKSQFLASMSHEIRTPMNGVLGMLGLLQNSPLEEQQRHRVDVAQKSAQSLLTLINDILDFSKIEAGKLDLELLPFSPRKILGDLADSLAHLAQVKGIELILDLSGINLSKAIGDPSRIRQVVTNLVNNAIKFTEQGEVVLSASLSPVSNDLSMLTVSVKDTGIGIPSKTLDNLFESFTQADASTTREFGGSGLGLSIAKNLCLMMGGDIEVASDLNKGSTFTCTMLLQDDDQAEFIQPRNDISDQDILIVVSNGTHQHVLDRQLKHWGAAVSCASNIESALTRCEDQHQKSLRPFDLILIDKDLVDQNGLDLAKQLHQDSRFTSSKLVLMTSTSFHGHQEELKDLGISHCFPKPATTKNLFQALRTLVNEQTDSSSNVSNQQSNNHSHDSQNEKPNWLPHSRILLVEDNQINQLVASSTLSNFGLSADIANNGQEALTALMNSGGSQPYNLVLMDCQMPEMDGYDATRAIRSGKGGAHYQDIPIIAMTANAMHGDKQKCIESGMNDYISKPINNEILLKLLSKYLGTIASESTSEQSNQNDPVDSVEITPLSIALSTPPLDLSIDWEHVQTQEHIDQTNLEIWNEKGLLKRVYGNADLFITLLETFQSEHLSYIESFKYSLEKSDYLQAQATAHLVKGVAGQLCAESLRSISESLEKACEQKDLILIDKLSELFEQHIIRLNEEFKTKAQELGQTRSCEGTLISANEIITLLKKLEEKLERSDYIEPELIQSFKTNFSTDEAINRLGIKLVESINLFDNDSASATLRELLKKLIQPQ